MLKHNEHFSVLFFFMLMLFYCAASDVVVCIFFFFHSLILYNSLWKRRWKRIAHCMHNGWAKCVGFHVLSCFFILQQLYCVFVYSVPIVYVMSTFYGGMKLRKCEFEKLCKPSTYRYREKIKINYIFKREYSKRIRHFSKDVL